METSNGNVKTMRNCLTKKGLKMNNGDVQTT
jgi:hypothetical protein